MKWILPLPEDPRGLKSDGRFGECASPVLGHPPRRSLPARHSLQDAEVAKLAKIEFGSIL